MTETEPETPTTEQRPDAAAGDSDAEETATPSDAFSVLGNEVRMAALRALADADGPLTFSELFEATSAEKTAGFAYHLRQLTGRFCRKTDDEEYVLTYAGREVTRAIRAGTYTDSVDVDPIPVEDPCPFCGARALEATGTDNYVAIACRACERPTLSLPFPPGGHRGHARENLLSAFDRHHRHRLTLLADGVCPECSAPAEARVEYRDGEELPDERPQVAFDCERCGCRLRSPVTLAVLEHPAVVAFYHCHGVDVRDRPLWNVGEEWREQVVSEEPWCVRVSTELDGDVLALFVAEDLTVVETRESTTAAS
ncbi:DUF7351 domain-containing protein [Halomicrococcus sp. NG-SE-24]|uniref:DUF7351 domain-containing protein n=1 Tax=Halomicrococcus sp. NG-SE-24 TaxID=3436928 RepID=UPI003D96670F